VSHADIASLKSDTNRLNDDGYPRKRSALPASVITLAAAAM
jgi:hypothetical protein